LKLPLSFAVKPAGSVLNVEQCRPWKAAGRRLDSVIMTDNLVTALDDEIVALLGKLPDLTPIDAALKHTLALA
jgi:hypothetical protein